MAMTMEAVSNLRVGDSVIHDKTGTVRTVMQIRGGGNHIYLSPRLHGKGPSSHLIPQNLSRDHSVASAKGKANGATNGTNGANGHQFMEAELSAEELVFCARMISSLYRGGEIKCKNPRAETYFKLLEGVV